MIKLRCLLVDDEPLAHTVLETYISQLDFLEIAGHCYSAFEALNFLNSQTADILFLDIEMPGLKGTALLGSLAVKPAVIMTTAYREFAAESYDYEVTDYLLKPFPFERFVRAVQRAQKQLQPAAAPPAKTPVSTAQNPDTPVFIRTDSETIRLPREEFLYAEGLKEYLKLHRPAGALVVKASFRQIEELFAPGELLRIHKSYLVATRHIERMRGTKLKVGLNWLPIGRSYKLLVQDFLQKQPCLQRQLSD